MKNSPTKFLVLNEVSHDVISILIPLDEEAKLHQWSPCAWASEVVNSNSRICLSYENNLILGFALFNIDPFLEFGHLNKIAVNLAYRNMGVGKNLINSVCRYLNELGAINLTLDVAISNKTAIKFYKSLNFHEVHKRNKFYTNGDGAFLMKRRL